MQTVKQWCLASVTDRLFVYVYVCSMRSMRSVRGGFIFRNVCMYVLMYVCHTQCVYVRYVCMYVCMFHAFYALGVLFSVIGGPCKRYAVALTRRLPPGAALYVCMRRSPSWHTFCKGPHLR
jgi:hypothetical protein